jgi:hypothetical protein
MKRIITIKGTGKDIQLEIKATVKTTGLVREESQNVAESLANLLFTSIGRLPYNNDFGVHNTVVSM